LIAIAAIAGWLGLEALASRDRAIGARWFEPSRIASKGPLAQAHAMWESTCEACHMPFTPINHSRWSPALRVGSQANDDRCAVCDRCRTCHAAPDHHANERQEEVPACAECHRDHRGREVSLLAMDNSACTRCHQDLPRHRHPGAPATSIASAVTHFDPANHPEFATKPVDRAASPRRIKFSHARHLAVGLTLQAGGAPFTFAQLASQDRGRYGWVAGQTLSLSVQLDCYHCHLLDGGDQLAWFGAGSRDASRTPLPSPGSSMLPIVYDRHCAACHSLSFDANVPDRKLTHGQTPADVIGWLRQFYAALAITTEPVLLRRFVPPRPIPGKLAARVPQRVEDAVAAKVLNAARRLFGSGVDETTRRQQKLPLGRGGCVECHNMKAGSARIVGEQDLDRLEIEPVLMTTVWFESAIFDHTSHRALDCTACHADVSSSRENGDRALLPGIAVCSSCHQAAEGWRSGQQPAASAACTECHRYHNGDHPGSGRGAVARRGTAALSIEQFRAGAVAPRQPDVVNRPMTRSSG
jgi:predicted CXXCH cytochrome family protein